MITRIRLPLQLLLVLLTASAVFALDITTRDGKTYKHAKITGVDPDGLRITHSTGVIKIPFENLPDTIKKEYHYDSVKVAAWRTAVEEAKKVEQAAQAAAARQADDQRRAAAAAKLGDALPLILVGALVVFAAIIIALAAGVSANRRRQRREEQRALLFNQAREWAANVQQNCSLPTVATEIILKPAESAFYSSPSVLYETRAVRYYQGGYTGFEVADGVYVGGSSGRSLSTQEWTRLDAGTLIITNQRLVFDGGTQDRTIPLKKVVSVRPTPTQVIVSVEGRQKAMVFEVANSLIASSIIKLCCQVGDPLNLSGDKVALEFKE